MCIGRYQIEVLLQLAKHKHTMIRQVCRSVAQCILLIHTLQDNMFSFLIFWNLLKIKSDKLGNEMNICIPWLGGGGGNAILGNGGWVFMFLAIGEIIGEAVGNGLGPCRNKKQSVVLHINCRQKIWWVNISFFVLKTYYFRVLVPLIHSLSSFVLNVNYYSDIWFHH